MPSLRRVPPPVCLVALALGATTSHAGALFPASIPLSSLDGAIGFRAVGTAQNDAAGWSVASGDINADGVPDLVIGAPGFAPGGVSGVGAVFVVFGKDTDGPGGPFPAALSLSTLNGANGFRLDGVLQSDSTGGAVACAGDINGDGVDDIVMGARGADPGNRTLAGSAFVFFGKNTAVAGAFPATIALSTLNGTNGFRADGGYLVENAGSAVAGAGDLNGDGVDDVVIGAESPGGGAGASPGGRAYVVYGKHTATSGAFPAVINLATLGGGAGFQLDSGATTEQCAKSVASCDVNGDGRSDLIIGAPGADQNMLGNSGSTYIVFGRLDAFPAAFNLAALTGANGFRINGGASLEAVGASVARAGDLNADGVDDFVLGAPLAAPGGVTTAGSAYVFFGRNTAATGPFDAVISVSALNGANGFRVNGTLTFDQVGFSSAPAGDINHDGVDDLLIGAVGTANLPGRAFVVFGHNTRAGAFPAAMSVGDLNGANGFRLDGIANNNQTACSVSPAGDLNDDGIDDLVVGAYRGATGGHSYVLYGRSEAVACPGDTNGDNVVDFADLNIVLTAFGSLVGQPGYIAGADLDGDDDVDFADLNVVLTFFGTVC